MSRSLSPDLPRLQALCQAAISTGGSLRRMCSVLGVSEDALRQRLSLLRRLGLARRMTLFDLSAVRGEGRSTAWVRMAQMQPAAIEAFEQILREDPHVVSAQRVTGDCDYRLSCLHQDHHQAARWARALRCRHEVREVRQVELQPLFGDELPGVVIRNWTTAGAD